MEGKRVDRETGRDCIVVARGDLSSPSRPYESAPEAASGTLWERKNRVLISWVSCICRAGTKFPQVP